MPQAEISVDVDLSGWYAQCARLKAVVKRLPVIEIKFEGIGWNGAPNATIAKHAAANGDTLFPLKAFESWKPKFASDIVKALKSVVEEKRADIRAEMQAGCDAALKALSTFLFENGAPDGPNRTPTWNEYKSKIWGTGGKNCLADGTFFRGLRAKLVTVASRLF